MCSILYMCSRHSLLHSVMCSFMKSVNHSPRGSPPLFCHSHDLGTGLKCFHLQGKPYDSLTCDGMWHLSNTCLPLWGERCIVRCSPNESSLQFLFHSGCWWTFYMGLTLIYLSGNLFSLLEFAFGFFKYHLKLRQGHISY